MITSAANPRLRALKKLFEDGDGESFAVEGVRAIEEALRAGVHVREVYYSQKAESAPRALTLIDSLVGRGAEKVLVGDTALQKVASTEHSQGIIAVVAKPRWVFDDLVRTRRPVFLFERLQDPGNLGTIIRLADAFALGGIITTPGSVGFYNAKVVRSAMGSLLRVPVLAMELRPAVHLLEDEQYTLLRAEMRHGIAAPLLRPTGPMAILFGNEGKGLSQEAERLVFDAVHIPMPGHAESLNVAVAAGILAYGLTTARGGRERQA